MKTALLICDHVPTELNVVHGDYLQMFNQLLRDVNLDPFYVIDGQFPNPSDYDAFVVTGSKFSVYDQISWIDDLKKLTEQIYHAEKKMAGVCFGHQLIAEALGGRVKKSDDGFQIGIHDFEITGKKSWMEPEVLHYKILMLCQDQVEILPPNSTVLASSPFCPNGMFVVGDNFLGIQGHPEFLKEYDRAVFESRIDKIGREKVKNAIMSFKDEPDRDLLSGYIVSFLKSQ